MRSQAARTPGPSAPTEAAPGASAVPAERRAWLARFPGCDSPDRACDCDDRLLAAAHRELDRGSLPKPTSGQLVITEFDLKPLAVTYFAPVLRDPPGICLGGPCPKDGPLRFELVGPGGRTSLHFGTFRCISGNFLESCKGPIETLSGSALGSAWLDFAPDDEALHMFVGNQLVYSTKRSTLPMSARVVLVTEPEHALALAFGDGEPEGTFVSVNIDAPLFDFPGGTSLKVVRRPEGCWSLIALGDRPFVDPLSVRLSDGFRTEIHELPAQDGVPAQSRARRSARVALSANARLARHAFDRGQQLGAVDLSFADLRKAYFSVVSAPGARLHAARLQHAYVRWSDFARADFSEADLGGAYLIGVDLHEADFRGANLERTRLDRSDLRGASLERARNLTQSQLDAACGDARTKLPPGLHITTCWELDASEEPASATPGELLVATPSGTCTTTRCPGQCCNVCGRVLWKLASDSSVQVVPEGVTLPQLAANECGLHYDLRAKGERKGDRFVVRAVRPIPSERGRRPGTPGQLELRAVLGDCIILTGCSEEDPCGCNRCSFEGWRPKPTLDRVTWSGEPLPDADTSGCEDGYDLAVTGTWRRPNAFEVKSIRMLMW